MKKCIIIVIIFLISGGCSSDSHQELPKSVQETTKQVQVYDELKIVEPVNKYLDCIKGDVETIFPDKLNKIKNYLSDELYTSLMPKLSQKQLDELRNEQTKEINNDVQSEIEVTDYAIHKSNENDKFNVFVIYTNYESVNGSISKQRYLMRANVIVSTDKYVLNKILEDSRLVSGLYSGK